MAIYHFAGFGGGGSTMFCLQANLQRFSLRLSLFVLGFFPAFSLTAQFATYAAGKLTEAWNLLPGITTTNTHEWNKKRVYEIYIGSLLFQGSIFTETQIADLKTLGQQCIEDGGKAVLLARGLLSECDYAAIRETVEDCYPPVEERSAAKKSQNTIAEVSITPNPANDVILLTATANGNLNIYTVEGRLQQQASFSIGLNHLHLNLPSGIFFFQSQTEDGSVRTQKVAIQH